MKTLVYGLGESGIATARALLYQGEHDVVVADAGDSESLRRAARELGVEGRLGAGPEVIAEGFDRVVVSPGIRPHDAVLVAAAERGLPILSEVALGLGLLGPGVRVAAVTGTNGKTTVADMLGAMLSAADVPHAVAGNSWRALTGCLAETRRQGLLVLEVSSFQLHYTPGPGFDVAALLNVRPDHLNWHASLEEYAADKLRVFDGQGPEDLALVSAADPVGRSASLAAEKLVIGEGATGVVDGFLTLRGRTIADVSELSFLGPHNHENALFAAAAAERLGAGLSGIREGLLGYEPKPHRMRVVSWRDGVAYVDDSKATNPASVAAALSSFEGPVVLILGGSEKGTDFSEVLPHLARCRAVICQGEAGPGIQEFLVRKDVEPDVSLCPDLAAAVERARRVARPGDVVLLSPGCASFDQFAGYAQRGEAFTEMVERLAVPGDGGAR